MDAGLRRILALLAGIAAIVLALIVLVASPADPTGLLAGAALAAGAGIVILAA